MPRAAAGPSHVRVRAAAHFWHASRSHRHRRRADHRPAARHQQPVARRAAHRDAASRSPSTRRSATTWPTTSRHSKRRSDASTSSWSPAGWGRRPTTSRAKRLPRAAGVGLVRDEASLEHIRELFASRGREMPERNAVQADFPVGATPIPKRARHGAGHRHATSSGRRRAPCPVFALPGVPAEMKPMWQRLGGAGDRGRSRRGARHSPSPHQVLRRRREPARSDAAGPHSPRPRAARRHHRERRDDHAAHHGRGRRRRRVPTRRWSRPSPIIRESLGTLVFGEEDDELEHVVATMLADQGKTLAVVELATGGLDRGLAGERRPSDCASVLDVGVVATDTTQVARLLAFSERERQP